MTVGQELQKLTPLKLFYNHMSLELVINSLILVQKNFNKLDREIRFNIFRELAKSDITGLIFTIVWAFDEKEDKEYIDAIIEVFKDRHLNICLIELICDQEERLKRNHTSNRLHHKPSKRDLQFSDRLLKNEDDLYRMNSFEEELREMNILKIDNSSKTAKMVAQIIVKHYNLE